MNGLIIVNKEKGYTSFDVCAIAKKIFKTKKVGHLGTLDPDATGVLVLCINDATKLVPFLEADNKEYQAEVLIGKSTKTYDASGEEIESIKLKVNDLTSSKVDEILKSFLGKQKQVPPMYSAIKINGEKLYNLARKDIVIDVPKRDIEIFKIERTSDLIYHEEGFFTFTIDTIVSKGTYIRSLCFDIGKCLGFPALMNNLERTRSGIFKLSDAKNVESLKNGDYSFCSMLEALANYQIIDDKQLVKDILNGKKIPITLMEKYQPLNQTVIFKNEDKLIGIYQKDSKEEAYRAVRVWN